MGAHAAWAAAAVTGLVSAGRANRKQRDCGHGDGIEAVLQVRLVVGHSVQPQAVWFTAGGWGAAAATEAPTAFASAWLLPLQFLINSPTISRRVSAHRPAAGRLNGPLMLRSHARRRKVLQRRSDHDRTLVWDDLAPTGVLALGVWTTACPVLKRHCVLTALDAADRAFQALDAGQQTPGMDERGRLLGH